MSPDNLQLVREAFEAWDRGDASAMLEAFADDATIYRPHPDARTYEGGAQGMVQAIADWSEDFDDWEVIPQECIEVDSSNVIVKVLQRARGKASGAPVEGDFWFVIKIKDQQATRLEFHIDEAQARAAAGIAE